MSDENNIPSRVSISYSVDLVEVPDRVKILMEELANSFGGIAKMCREAAKKVVSEPVAGTRQIAELKTLIDKAATRADDSVEIMMGYVRILQQLASQTQEAEAAEAAAAAKEVAEAEPEEVSKKKSTTKKSTTKKSTTKKSTKKKSTKKKEK